MAASATVRQRSMADMTFIWSRLTWQREHEVEVADGQQFGLALGEPFLGGGALTLGAACPALALRHAAPWSRKISATSNVGRGTAARRYAGGGSFRLFLAFLRGCESRSNGLSMPAIMPVATRV
jgi:hypothetical protein